MKTTITIKGTHCPACKSLIEEVCLEDIPGVISCEVNYESGETTIEHDDGLDWQLLKKEIEGLGSYKVIVSS